MRIHHKGLVRATAAALLACAAAGTAGAATIVFDTTGRGWRSNGSVPSNGISPANNYYAGESPTGVPPTEYRNFFFFDPVFSGTVSSARLLFWVYSYASSDPMETYQVTSLGSTFGFNDLGTGTFYGSYDIQSSEAGSIIAIPLNAAAISNIVSGQTFRVGGRITTLNNPNDHREAVFTNSGGYAGSTRLELTLADTVVPEPSSFALAGLGLLGIGLWGRRRMRAR